MSSTKSLFTRFFCSRKQKQTRGNLWESSPNNLLFLDNFFLSCFFFLVLQILCFSRPSFFRLRVSLVLQIFCFFNSSEHTSHAEGQKSKSKCQFTRLKAPTNIEHAKTWVSSSELNKTNFTTGSHQNKNVTTKNYQKTFRRGKEKISQKNRELCLLPMTWGFCNLQRRRRSVVRSFSPISHKPNYTDTNVPQIDNLFYRQQLPIPVSKKFGSPIFYRQSIVRKCVLPTIGKCPRSRQITLVRTNSGGPAMAWSSSSVMEQQEGGGGGGGGRPKEEGREWIDEEENNKQN